MAITITLEDEMGKVFGQAFDFQNTLVPRKARSGGLETRLLRFVDPYGLAVFNRNQMEDLRLDLECLLRSHTSPDELETIQQVLALVELCRRGRRVYLRFLGD